MELYKGRPVVTSEDHPEIIGTALRESIGWANRGLLDIPPDAAAWRHTAQNGYETLEDVFGRGGYGAGCMVPGAKATLHCMTPARLAEVMTHYKNHPDRTEDERMAAHTVLSGLQELR